MSDLIQSIDPASEAHSNEANSSHSAQEPLTPQERRDRAAERLGAEIRTWPCDAQAGDMSDVGVDLGGEQEALTLVSADRTAVEALLEAEAETVMPGMSLVAIRRVQHPHLRAAALLMTDMCALIRGGFRGDLELMVHSVRVPQAGALGELAHAAYEQARDARTPAKQTAFAKKLKARNRDLIGFGRFALAEKAIELTLQNSGGDVAVEPAAA